MSGGVIIAATVIITTKVCFRYFLRKEGETIPALVKKKIRTGNSKSKPVASVTDATEPMYDPRLIWFVTSLDTL